ncbi:SPOR domain-containing protein [Kordiimonas sp. SCSIO 12610]|uniref:SPOR domain-containing protein n=1 Tax=Kordiimonas sp. SCSIO 12610 TaxID=2829597 RepID=UPI00210EA5CE|nr:SPOR domain-containing protein [Kordiimonas sp. SCSIO 12610]UTW54233.1 SPOR domain-containing protein [Kordiimonas sp. SCSIO 12610]
MSDRETPPWLQPVPEEEGSDGLFGGKLVFVFAGVAAILVVVFIAAIYVFGTSDQAQNGPRIITASGDPIKERPSDQGGMNIPHQDKQVFEQGAGNPNTSAAQLGEQPEQPVEELPKLATNIDEGEVDQVTTDAQKALNDVLADVEDGNDQASSEPVATQSAPEKVETAKVEVPKITLPKTVTEKAKVEAQKGEFVIQLGAYGTRARAERAWPGLRQKYRPQLGDLSPIYEPVQSGGRTLYRLRAGWLATRADSDKLCLALKAKGQACIVVKP